MPRALIGDSVYSKNRKEASLAGVGCTGGEGVIHKWVERADHVGAFYDLGRTWALPPKGDGRHGRVQGRGAQSSYILIRSL